MRTRLNSKQCGAPSASMSACKQNTTLQSVELRTHQARDRHGIRLLRMRPANGNRLSAARSHAEKRLTLSMSATLPPEARSSLQSLSEVQLTVLCGLAGVGFLGVLSMAVSGVQFAWRQYLRPAKAVSQYGKWAVVTGASGGIGRAYCDYLANQGARHT